MTFISIGLLALGFLTGVIITALVLDGYVKRWLRKRIMRSRTEIALSKIYADTGLGSEISFGHFTAILEALAVGIGIDSRLIRADDRLEELIVDFGIQGDDAWEEFYLAVHKILDELQVDDASRPRLEPQHTIRDAIRAIASASSR